MQENKKIQIVRLLYILLSLVFTSCSKDKADNKAIYITDPYNTGSNLRTLTVDDKGGFINISASSSHLVTSDATVMFTLDTSLLSGYNQKTGSDYKPLPSRFLSLSDSIVHIRKGTSMSDIFKIVVLPLDTTISEGDNYMIPIKIKSVQGDIPILEPSRTVYYAVKRVLIKPALDVSRVSDIAFNIHDPISNLTKFTVEMRVKVTGNFVNNMALFFAYPSEIYSRFGDVVIDPNQLQIKLAGIQPPSTTKFSSNRWYHIAYTFDGSSNSFKIYVDGELDATATTPSDTKFNINSMGFGNRQPFHVQELRFWTKLRSQVEIKNSICSVNPTSDGLYGYWKFDAGVGSTIEDKTGHNHTGTISGTPRWVAGVRCPD